MTAFAVEVAAARPAAAVITLRGHVGAIDADDVARACVAVAEAGARRVVVDLVGAEITDADPLTALYELARVVRARDGLVAIATPPRSDVRRILRTIGLDVAFTIYDSRTAALVDLDLTIDEPAA